MPWHECIGRANQMVDDLYDDREEATREEIVARTRRAALPPDVIQYFEQLPPGSYGREALVRRVNRMIREHQRLRVRQAA